MIKSVVVNKLLKPSIASVEGTSVLGLFASVITLLHELITSMGVKPSVDIPIDVILAKAKTAKEIAEIYTLQANQVGGWNISDGWSATSIIALLIFMYKIYDKFIASRNELKLKEMEIKANVE